MDAETKAAAIRALNAAKADTRRRKLSNPQPTGEPVKVEIPKASSSNTVKTIPIASGPTANSKKYTDIDSVRTGDSKTTLTWRNDSFSKIKVYEVTQLNDDDCVLYGRAVFDAINTGNITSDVVFMMLYLAISIRSTGDKSENYLLAAPTGMTDLMGLVRPTVSDQAMATAGGSVADVDNIFEADKQPRKRGKGKSTKTGKVGDELVNNIEGVRNNHREADAELVGENKTYQAAAFSYAAAFLLRLQCKREDNTVPAFEKAVTRYNGFYDSGGETLHGLALTLESCRALREVIGRKPELIGTWVAWVAYNENERKAGMLKQDAGLLEYLAIQVFAFQGMHVVTQTLAIHQLSAVPLGKLLREMDCQMTRRAVEEVYGIIKNHQATTAHPERKTYFRYARVWNEGYFPAVQSKSCTHLLYLASKVVKQLNPSAGSDPTQIYALKDMGEDQKARLDKVANKLLDFIWTQTANDPEAGSIWKDIVG
uniref:Nucleoprotein n=1 Tax=Cytorhabdovirus medicagonis TaxID=1972639 RepID=A0A2U8JAC1_9RHAB|nr:nucleoprotein [Cytorhabdovirus medicagonis]